MAFFRISKSESLCGFVYTWILIQMFSSFYMVSYIEVCSALSFYFTGLVSQFKTMPPVLMVQYKYYKYFIFIIWCLWRRSGQLAEQGACSGYDLKLSRSNADWLSEAEAIYACAVQRCRKQEDAVFLLHSTQGNTPHNCCQISAKLNNSIIPHSCTGLATFVCNNQISVEARRVVLSETLSSSIARRLFSLKTILLIKRGVTVERGSEEHRLLVQLFVPC